jgi:hypothetical protein
MVIEHTEARIEIHTATFLTGDHLRDLRNLEPRLGGVKIEAASNIRRIVLRADGPFATGKLPDAYSAVLRTMKVWK